MFLFVRLPYDMIIRYLPKYVHQNGRLLQRLPDRVPTNIKHKTIPLDDSLRRSEFAAAAYSVCPSVAVGFR